MTLMWTKSLVMIIIMILLLDSNSGVRTLLPPPASVSVESVDMRHILRWRPLQVSCNTSSALYSVQFQGEFELTVLNDSWVDAAECQLIPRSHCDLTLDLGSDSDYSVRVRAKCGSQLSTWAVLSPPFNRKNSVLTVPDMKVSAVGDTLQVSFDKVPPSAVIRVTVWRSGNELKADVYSIAAEQAGLNIADLQEGVKYCVRARLILENQLQSNSTDTHCDVIPGSGPAWRTVTTVTVTIVLMSVLLSAIFSVVVHCDFCQTYFQKDPHPLSLPSVWDLQTATVCHEPEVCDLIDAMINSEQQTLKSDEDEEDEDVFVSHVDKQGVKLPSSVDVVDSYCSQLRESTAAKQSILYFYV
ncbi:cytokine receptor family member B16 isoform X2 [Solea solea]|uniref:cytokine receptor family member B16 isoform X2 n=1 Tax=Solea solea TaxID=90069 RepID=UPI00272AC947|nr:cytokine receptor family member B16 isoform X2 [Solea solea]